MNTMYNVRKSTLLIEFLVGITAKIQLEWLLFYGHSVQY